MSEHAPQLSAADSAYLAGLVDGEGTITLARFHRGANRQLSVTISSTELQILEHVKNTLGMGQITSKRTEKSRHSPSFTYKISNRQALGLLEQIQPYLQSYKRIRADLILRHYVDLTPRNGKYSTELLQKKHAFEKLVLSVKANSQINT